MLIDKAHIIIRFETICAFFESLLITQDKNFVFQSCFHTLLKVKVENEKRRSLLNPSQQWFSFCVSISSPRKKAQPVLVFRVPPLEVCPSRWEWSLCLKVEPQTSRRISLVLLLVFPSFLFFQASVIFINSALFRKRQKSPLDFFFFFGKVLRISDTCIFNISQASTHSGYC